MEQFRYDNQISYGRNFRRWYLLNCEEKTIFKEDKYDRRQAWKIFQTIHPLKLAHSYKYDKNGVLQDVLIPDVPTDKS